MRGPGFFAFAERKRKCLMIMNNTKFSSVPRSVRPIPRKSRCAASLKNAGGAHTPHTDLFAGAVMGAASGPKLKD